MGYNGIVAALTPFIPPFLRVNEQTWVEIKALCPSLAQLRSVLTWQTLKYTVYFAIWTAGLVWSGGHDLVTLYIIASLFTLIVANLGDKEKDSVIVDEHGRAVSIPSAYSVFNTKAKRLAGQLTTEHFEQQIRNRGPLPEDDSDDDDDDDDPDLQEALRQSRAFANAGAGQRLGGGAMNRRR
ncbi:hypothetical protein B5M09_006911 [Aphanomyces astaci]|uniref:SAYSvFN domain-containing protein n=1 Tax=Aphanomyces astaci TaxID=112090 RepID=A0A425C395_APHAT|nr:hypothetical protein B5M09_006911 [Aphanomyces astaci]